ncbi:uncharacterized protein LOC116738657 [Nasonia vitripennis]|uniref:Uncharacterized protein n=1 Tax=Nasonia vitripennis TaxID=7425 RepID=A0A7M7R1H4_NASVI|nr:uncharacterized protein LOC116738657 [Nasonia vitripennis]
MPRQNKKVLDVMKDECAGSVMVEFFGLRSKMYCVRVDGQSGLHQEGEGRQVSRGEKPDRARGLPSLPIRPGDTRPPTAEYPLKETPCHSGEAEEGCAQPPRRQARASVRSDRYPAVWALQSPSVRGGIIRGRQDLPLQRGGWGAGKQETEASIDAALGEEEETEG